MQKNNNYSNNNFSLGIYPGTFDPVTFGHLDIIKRAVKIVDKLIIGVAADNNKHPLFSIKERVEMVKNEIANINQNNNIEVIGFSGLLIDFAKKNNSTILIRGLRAVSDFEYEFQMAAMNAKLDKEIQTIFLPASESAHFVASKLVKEIAKLNGDVSLFVSEGVKSKLNDKFSKN